jgi:hypothetical protein
MGRWPKTSFFNTIQDTFQKNVRATCACACTCTWVKVKAVRHRKNGEIIYFLALLFPPAPVILRARASYDSAHFVLRATGAVTSKGLKGTQTRTIPVRCLHLADPDQK